VALSLCPDLEKNEKVDEYLETALEVLEKIFIVGASVVGVILCFVIICCVIRVLKHKHEAPKHTN